MKLSIFGVGYVGLVTGACFTKLGHYVTCFDTDQQKIEHLMRLQIPIYEPGLDKLLKKATKTGRIQFTNNLQQAVKFADCIFIAVGTPSNKEGAANLNYIESAISEIAQHLQQDTLIILKSTVPIGTSKRVLQQITKVLIDRNVNLNIMVAYNPEFLREGSAVHDFMLPTRIVIGSDHADAIKILKKLYKPLKLAEDKFIIMDSIFRRAN